MSNLPTYESDPFWTPESVQEAAELSADLQRCGIDPSTMPSMFGPYADLAGDLAGIVADLTEAAGEPVDLALAKGDIVEWGSDSGAVAYGVVKEIDPQNQQANVEPLVENDNGELVRSGERRLMMDVDLLSPSSKQLAPDVLKGWSNTTRKTGPADASADLSDLERRWEDILGEDFHRPSREETGGSADLSDDDLSEVWQRTSKMSGYEYNKFCRRFKERHADLSEEPAADLTDDQLYAWGQEVLDGTDGRRRAMKQVEDARQEELEYWRHQHELGQPLPRDVEGLL